MSSWRPTSCTCCTAGPRRAASSRQARQHLEAAIAAAESLGDEMYLYFFREDLAILLLIEASS